MLVHQYYYRDGRVRRYSETLVEQGNKVDVICPEDFNQSNYSFNGVRIFTIPLERTYKQKSQYLIEYGLAFFLYTFRLIHLYLKYRYHIIHVHNIPDFMVFTAIVPKLFGAKIILDIHDPMPELFFSKYKSAPNGIVARILKFLEKISIKYSNVVITANDNFKNNLIIRGVPEKKITVINNVANANIFNRKKYNNGLQKNNDHFTLIYPGTIAPRYGLEIAIKALPALSKKIPDLQLLIIGNKVDYADELVSLAKKLDVLSFIEIRPAIPINKIPQEIAKADIGIYPALSDPHMDIATPTKVLEYAIMGIPIVASRLKVLEDLFDEASIMFFKPGDVEEFSNCVFELYNNPTLRTQLVQNADSVFVNKHSWENEKRKYLDLLNNLI